MTNQNLFFFNIINTQCLTLVLFRTITNDDLIKLLIPSSYTVDASLEITTNPIDLSSNCMTASKYKQTKEYKDLVCGKTVECHMFHGSGFYLNTADLISRVNYYISFIRHKLTLNTGQNAIIQKYNYL